MPTITGVSPQAFGDGRQVTVTGSGFGASGTVTIGGVAQNILSWTDTAVVFTAVRGTQSMGPAVLDVVASTGAIALYDGLSFTLAGAFPNKTQAAPIYFQDFAEAQLGMPYTAVGLTDDGGGDGTGLVQVSANRAYLGTQSLRCDYGLGNVGQFPRIVLGGLNENEIFASCALYWERYITGTDPGSSLIFKQWRAGKSPVYSSAPRSFQTIRPSYATGQQIASSDKGFVTSGGVVNFNGGDGTCFRDRWNRIDHWYKLSTPGGADGVCAFYSNLALDEANSSAPLGVSALACATRGAADAGAMIQQVMTPLDGVDLNGTDNAYYVYIDHLYIDNTPIRVELGDAPTYAACTERVICPASAWSTSSITATAYTSRWAEGDTVYAYVIGSDNAVAAGPFAYTVGVGTAPLFTDDFQSGSFETTQNGVYWTAGGDADVTIQPGRGVNGTNSAQFQFVGGASGTDAGAERRFDLGALYTEVVIEFDLYIPNGLESWGGAAYAHRDDPPSANNKFFRLWPVTYDDDSKVGASLFPTTSPGVISNIRSEWVLTGNAAVGQAGQALTPFIATADLGEWIAVKIYCNADLGTGTGSMRIYKNGTLVIDNTDVMDNYAGRENVAPYGWRYGYLLGYANSGFDATTYLQMDNVRFYGIGKPAAPTYAPLATWSATGGVGGNAITGWASRGRLSYVTTRGPFGGTVVAGETIPSGSTAYGGTWINNTTIAAPGETLWFRMYVRFSASFAFNYGTTPSDGWGGLKFIRFEDTNLNGGGVGNRYTFQLAVSSAASGTRTTTHVRGGTDEVGPSPNPNDFFSPTPPDLITRDNWHSIEVSLKVADTASSNGYIRAWIDDVFAGEITGVDSVSIGHVIKQLTIGDYWNGSVIQNNTWYMDEFILTKQTPDLTDREGRPVIGASRRVSDF